MPVSAKVDGRMAAHLNTSVKLTVGPGQLGQIVTTPDTAAPVVGRLLRHSWQETEKKEHRFLFFVSQAWVMTALVLAGSLLVLAASLPQTTLTRFGFVFGTLALGTLLYFFRCRWLGWYGALEIAVGVGSAAYVIVKYADLKADDASLTFLLSAVGALYIIVRGYDNLFKAIEKHPKHARAARIWKKIFFGAGDVDPAAAHPATLMRSGPLTIMPIVIGEGAAR